MVISDLYLIQEIVLLNPCFKFSKNLMLLFMDKLAAGGSAAGLVSISGVFDI